MSAALGWAGLVLLAGVFVWAGIEHFFKFGAISGGMAAKGLPAPGLLLAAGSILEIVAGIGLLIGPVRPWAALALVLFLIAATLMMLDFWNATGPQRDGLRSAFTTNIAVAGGLILAGLMP